MRRTFERGAIRIRIGKTLALVSMKIVAVMLHDLAGKTPQGINAPTAHFIALHTHFIEMMLGQAYWVNPRGQRVG